MYHSGVYLPLIEKVIVGWQIKQYRNERMLYTLVRTPKGKARLLRKYPFIALTDKGSFTWVDLYLAERGKIQF